MMMMTDDDDDVSMVTKMMRTTASSHSSKPPLLFCHHASFRRSDDEVVVENDDDGAHSHLFYSLLSSSKKKTSMRVPRTNPTSNTKTSSSSLKCNASFFITLFCPSLKKKTKSWWSLLFSSFGDDYFFILSRIIIFSVKESVHFLCFLFAKTKRRKNTRRVAQFLLLFFSAFLRKYTNFEIFWLKNHTKNKSSSS